MWSGLAQLLFDGRQIPLSIRYRNSARAAFNFSASRRRGRANTGGPFVSMWCVVVLSVALFTGCLFAWKNSSNSARICAKGQLILNAFIVTSFARIPVVLAAIWVVVSISRLRLRSITIPKCLIKSAPMIGVVTSATMKVRVNARLRPRSTVSI